MAWRSWDRLPDSMRLPEVRPYYNALEKKRVSLLLKRGFDFVAALLLTVILSPVLLVLAVCVKIESPGPALFRQKRVTRYGRAFRICKFRSMVADAEARGGQVTVKSDSRVTRMGRLLRGSRLDELPQLFNILTGNMSFVGTRPEVPKYVAAYTPEMAATLLLPAGVTSLASIKYKDEAELLAGAADADEVYIQKVLPEKMKYNLEEIEKFSFFRDLKTMVKTVSAVIH